jgi:two-component system chemotaxis sensor kinase CheA
MTVHAATPAETFRSEAEDLLVELEAALLDLESDPSDREQIDRAFRALHTIKGSGAMFGFERVAAFTHHVESAFQKVRDGELVASHDLVGLALASLDHIRVLLGGGDDAVKEEELLGGLRRILGTGPASSAVAPASGEHEEPATETIWRIRLVLGPQVMAFGTNPLLLLDELSQLGECVVVALPDKVPPLTDMDPTVCYVAWDILLTTARPRSAIDDVFIFVVDDAQLSIEQVAANAEVRLGEVLVQRGDVAEQSVAEILSRQQPIGEMLVKDGKTTPEHVESALAEQHQARDKAAKQAAGDGQGSIRVQAERLDGLMDQVGELVIAQARLRQLVANSDDLGLKAISEEIERLSSELRDTTMGIRMLPIGTLFGRFRRVVRDLSQALGKDVELTVEGEDNELDKTLIERLNDPLVHLIRNAIDHGIEPADRRRAAGKPEKGRVHLAAVHSGAQVLISVTDDGGGMDRAVIRAKAEERGLLAPDATISDGELLAFIFHAGFSTAAQVSSVSGRGVGMDVVKRTIDSLRGTIEVSSSLGKGSTVTLKLPLTLAIIDGLLVRVGKGMYVLPLAAVEECVELTPEEDARATGCSFLNIRGDLVPFLRLREVFHAATDPDPYQKVVVVSSGPLRVGLVVDQVVGQHQTVIKSLSKLLDDVHEFSGATILGDGSVALILDVPRLLALGQDQEARRLAS